MTEAPKARCLTEREMEEKTQRQGELDREVRVLPLRASRARSVRFPGGDGRRGQPDGDVASTDQRAIRGGPVLDVVLCLVRGMDSRFHPSSLVCPLATSLRIRAPTPLHGSGAVRDLPGALALDLHRRGGPDLRPRHRLPGGLKRSCLWDWFYQKFDNQRVQLLVNLVHSSGIRWHPALLILRKIGTSSFLATSVVSQSQKYPFQVTVREVVRQ